MLSEARKAVYFLADEMRKTKSTSAYTKLLNELLVLVEVLKGLNVHSGDLDLGSLIHVNLVAEDAYLVARKSTMKTFKAGTWPWSRLAV